MRIISLTVIGCTLAAMAGCGVDDSFSSKASGGNRSEDSKAAGRPTAVTKDGQASTWWEAWGGSPDQGEAAEIGDTVDESGEPSPGVVAPPDPHATLAAQVQDAGPRAVTVLEDGLESENISHQLAALERLGARSEWDIDARHALEAFRDRQSNDGLRRRAADLLARHQPIVVPQGDEPATAPGSALN